MTPDGSPDVFLTDMQFHNIGGLDIKAGFKNSALTMEFEDQGYSYVMSFEIVKATNACGTNFEAEKTILLRTATQNGIPSSQNCVYWLKQ